MTQLLSVWYSLYLHVIESPSTNNSPAIPTFVRTLSIDPESSDMVDMWGTLTKRIAFTG